MGKVATSPLPPRVSPPLQSGGAKSEVAHKWARWLHHPCRLGDPHRFKAGGAKSEVAHKWARWLHHPCRLGYPHRFRAGGQNQKWPINGQGGYITPAASGIPAASKRAAKSEVAHKWARWLHHPCRLGDPHSFRAGVPNQKWPINGQGGYITPAAWGFPPLQSGGAKSEVAHNWARWLHHPCRLGDPHRFRAGGKIRNGPQMGKVATSPLPPRGSPPLQSGGGGNQKWPINGQGGYVEPCRFGDPHHFKAGGKIRSGP